MEKNYVTVTLCIAIGNFTLLLHYTALEDQCMIGSGLILWRNILRREPLTFNQR